jgi:hypothetical protein
MLFGEYEIVEEFLAFLCKACFASFSFAHRIVWFLKSMMNPENSLNEKIRTILHLIQTIFKSEKKSSPLERLHVAGSKKFIEFIEHEKEDSSSISNISNCNQINQETKHKIVRQKLNEYIDFTYSCLIQEKNSSDMPITCNSPNLKLSYDDLYLEIFNRYECITNDENNINTQYVKQIDINDINLSSFLSNINFVDHLCNICEIVRYTSIESQEKTLLNELRKINKILPSNVYLPFLNDSIRNYVIASIPLSEVKIFRTKNRAPYMITFECFRLDELNYNYHMRRKPSFSHKNQADHDSPHENSSEEDNLKSDSVKDNNTSAVFNSHSKKTLENLKEQTKLNKNTAYDDFNMQKSNTFSDSLLNDINKEKKQVNLSLDSKIIAKGNRKSLNLQKSGFYTAIRDKKTKNRTILEIIKKSKSKKSLGKEREKNKILFGDYLLESDVNISKPLIIKNILYNQTEEPKNISKQKKKKKNFMKLDENDYETDPEDYKRVENVINENVKKEVRKLSFEKETNNRKSSYDEEIGISKLEIDCKNIDTEILDQTKVIELENSNKNEDNNSNLADAKNYEYKNLNSNNSKIVDRELMSPEEILNPYPKKSNLEVCEIFGEKTEKQRERLKKASPFGFLNTYKLFKIIVKSGEDLRQEQFASQLINEFYQIFKIEKVECWVNTYEILATGNNVGIIEVVPNSISLDSLKRKSKNITSLKQFFDLYFIMDSDNYKRAMKNFISSLAGYSLVCYFLQIKDRHNANILIDDQGHLIHIDFGFMLSNAPGKGLQFEKAPFKLTKEFVDVLGGVESKNFSLFRKLLWK